MSSRKRKIPNQAGFTLLEILVALSVAAVGLAAISQALTTNVETTQEVENRLIGTWVASNRLTEIRLAGEWRVDSEARTTVNMAGRDWFTVERYEATPDPDLARIDVRVFTDQDTERQVAHLFGYNTRPREQEGRRVKDG